MRKSSKAALYSALLFPGSGHFLLRKYIRGVLLAGISIVCLYVLVAAALEIAQQISDEILSGQMALDSARISEEVSRRSAGNGFLRNGLPTYLLIACWLFGIVDSWRVGRLQDKRDHARSDNAGVEQAAAGALDANRDDSRLDRATD